MKKTQIIISSESNYKLRVTIPQFGNFDAVIDPACNYSIIPEKVFIKRDNNMVPFFKVLRTSFGKQKVRMTILNGVKVLGNHIDTLEVAIVPGASHFVIGKNLLVALQKKGVELEYRFKNM